MSAAVHDQLRAAEVFQKSYSSYQGLYEGEHSLTAGLSNTCARASSLASRFPEHVCRSGDYIGHRAAYEALKPLLRGKGSSFSMLDLG